tara:strand:+ start:398 stop:589 length:192 start_codon:yes stop_codon:yes gene_type:complete
MDIKIYNVVQTGPKTHAGGLKEGSNRPEYQGSLKELVTYPPIAEAKKVIAKNKKSVKYLFFII